MSVEATGCCVYGNRISNDDLRSCFDYELIAAKCMDGANPDDICIEEILWYFGLDNYFIDDEAGYVDNCYWYYGTILCTGIELEHITDGLEKVDSILLSMDNTNNGFDYDKFCEFTEAEPDQIWIFTRWS